MTETKGTYIRGGNGSHWDGCEETHWDCKISQLESALAEAREDAQRLADELTKTLEMTRPVVWEEAGENSPALMMHNNINAKYAKQ